MFNCQSYLKIKTKTNKLQQKIESWSGLNFKILKDFCCCKKHNKTGFGINTVFFYQENSKSFSVWYCHLVGSSMGLVNNPEFVLVIGEENQFLPHLLSTCYGQGTFWLTRGDFLMIEIKNLDLRFKYLLFYLEF